MNYNKLNYLDENNKIIIPVYDNISLQTIYFVLNSFSDMYDFLYSEIVDNNNYIAEDVKTYEITENIFYCVKNLNYINKTISKEDFENLEYTIYKYDYDICVDITVEDENENKDDDKNDNEINKNDNKNEINEKNNKNEINEKNNKNEINEKNNKDKYKDDNNKNEINENKDDDNENKDDENKKDDKNDNNNNQ